MVTSPPLSVMVSQHSILLIGLIYVDDCDLFVFLPSADQAMAAIQALQNNVLLWQGGLHSTGNSLSFKKCSWSVLSYQHQGAHWLPHSCASAPVELMVSDPSSNLTPIQCISPSDVLEVVGVAQSLLGNPQLSLLALQKKESNFLLQHLLWMTLHHIMWPLLQYLLLVTSLNLTQVAELMTCLYQVLLPCLGVNCHFLVTLCHVLPGHHGLGLPNPYWEQGISGLCLFLKQANASSSEATLIWASLEFLQLELGTHSNVFSLPFNLEVFGDQLLAQNHLAVCQLCPIAADSPYPSYPTSPQQYDGAIMEDVLSSPLPKASILAINHCCIAHQAIYWSDVVNSWGGGIAPATMLCPPSILQSSWSWPLEKPSCSDWSI